MKTGDHQKSNVTENLYPRKQIWIDLVTNINQSAVAWGTKKKNNPQNQSILLAYQEVLGVSLELPKDITKACTIYLTTQTFSLISPCYHHSSR